MHAMRSLTRREFSAILAWKVSVEFQDRLPLYHDPSNPCIGQREHHEETHDGPLAEVEKLNAEGEGQEHTGREQVNGPFESHGNKQPWGRQY